MCHVIPEDAILRAQDRMKEVELLNSLGKGIGSGWHLSQTGERERLCRQPRKTKTCLPFHKEEQPNWGSALAQSPPANCLPQSALTAEGRVGRRSCRSELGAKFLNQILKPLPILFTTNSDRD